MENIKLALKFLVALCFIFISPTKLAANAPIEFVVVIPSFNNEKVCIKNVESVVKQTYPYWEIIYLNDCSTDKTGEKVTNYVRENGLEQRIKIINNPKNRGAMANYYHGIMLCPPHKVVATLDGDDWLAHPRVLEMLAKIYEDGTIWATHGNYTTEPFKSTSYCTAYPKKLLKKNQIRNHIWLGCQLRTFYAKLFHLIDKKDLMWNGDFVPMTSDLAFMFPIIEMASQGHLYFVDEIIYIVNTINPLSDIKKDKKLQADIDKHIRSLPPYKPLKWLF